MLRHEIKLIGLNDVESGLCHLVHLHKPLRLDHGLDCRMAAVMCADRVCDRNNLHEKPLLFKILHYLPARLIAVHTRVLSAQLVHGGVVVQNVDLLKVVALAHLEVVGVMSRGDLHAACTERLVDMLIDDNRNLAVRQRKLQHLPDYICIALIIRRYRYRGIAQHRLRTGRSDLDIAALLSYDRVADMPERTVLVLVLDLGVRQGSPALRAPVNDPASLVDPSFPVETAEHMLNRP